MGLTKSDEEDWKREKERVTKMVSFVVESSHERGIEIKKDESGCRGIFDFSIEFSHRLLQQNIVEVDKQILSCITLLEGGCNCGAGKAAQWLKSGHHYLWNPQPMDPP